MSSDTPNKLILEVADQSGIKHPIYGDEFAAMALNDTILKLDPLEQQVVALQGELTAAQSALASKEAELTRFFMDHGLWHDRVTGQHMYTQDQYDELRRDAFHHGHESRQEEIDTLRAELEACRRDALRYKQVRDSVSFAVLVASAELPISQDLATWVEVEAEELDARTDEAMKGGEQG